MTDETRQWLQAAKDCDTEWLEKLLNEGFDIDCIAEPRSEGVKVNLTCRSALSIAAMNGHAEALQFLISKKANVHHSGREVERCPPIFDASVANRGVDGSAMMQMLIRAGASIDEIDPVTGDTVLHGLIHFSVSIIHFLQRFP